MPRQSEKFTPKEELEKLNPTPVETKKPIELTQKQDEHFINLLQQAKEAERKGDLEQAIKLYLQYKEEYQALKEKKEGKKEKTKDKKTEEKEFKDGDLICHYEGEWDGWRSHPQGVVIRKGDEFLLNGKDLLYKGKWDYWESHPQGVVIRKGNEFLLNGKDLLYKGEWDNWKPHPQGLVIQKGDEFLLNGKDLLYKGEWDNWDSHPQGQGVVIQKGNNWFIYTIKK